MDERWRDVDSSLLPWLEEAKAGAVTESASTIQDLIFGTHTVEEKARGLVNVVAKHPGVHARLCAVRGYQAGVEVAREVLEDAARPAR